MKNSFSNIVPDLSNHILPLKIIDNLAFKQFLHEIFFIDNIATIPVLPVNCEDDICIPINMTGRNTRVLHNNRIGNIYTHLRESLRGELEIL